MKYQRVIGILGLTKATMKLFGVKIFSMLYIAHMLDLTYNEGYSDN